jgi:hypothetical protein
MLETRDDTQALIERVTLDRDLLFRLLSTDNISEEISNAGFGIDAEFQPRVEGAIRKIRAYITDQLHVLSYKDRQRHEVNMIESGNGPYW